MNTRRGRGFRNQAVAVAAALALAGSLSVPFGSGAEPRPAAQADLVLRGGTVVDGTGAVRRTADVALKGDRIVAVGDSLRFPGAREINASGLVVAPGFIDLHTHSDDAILRPATRTNRNYQAQGVTTVVTGNCGGGALDVARYFGQIDRQGAGTNVIHLVPLGTVRSEVMGNAVRRPEGGELDRMCDLVERGMKAGAWGVSTGLIYIPGRYAETDEIVALARVASRFGGIYASHIRNEGEKLLPSIGEALKIGERAGLPVHVSHLKASGKVNWGLTGAACKLIASARLSGRAVTADQYPYVASSTRLSAMVVPDWSVRGSDDDFRRIAADPARGARLRREIAASLKERDGGASVRIARYTPKPSRVGKNLDEIARAEGTTAVDVVIDIQGHGGAQAISFGMSEADVRDVMRHDFVATASDGGAHRAGSGDQPHPRSYGTFPRKFRYSLDDKILTLEQAVRSCSGLPAEILRLPDRGVIRAGAFADVVVFDPDRFRDSATFDEPTQLAPEVRYLFVNGTAVIADGQASDLLPGRSLRLNRDGPADLILEAERVWTGDPAKPWAEAVACRAGEVVAVGTRDEVRPFRGPNTRVIEKPGGFVLPGLIDAHGHLADLGAEVEEVDLRGVASLDEVRAKVKARIEATPGGGWVTGRNWDQSLWPGGQFPSAADLDRVAPDRPVWLRRVDGHAGWANSEAMRRAGVTSSSQPPPDGQIVRDAEGRPTGVFVDGAMGLVARAVPAPSSADFERFFLKAQSRVFAAGLTGVHDAGLSRSEVAALRALDRDGRLKLRVYGMASLPEGREVEVVSRPPEKPVPGARFELRAVKAFIDGAMGSRGGLLFEPYSDDPGHRGLQLIKPEILQTVTTEALRRGWQVCTHAIGDRGNALVVDAYEAALKAVPGARDPRLRVEHAQVVRRSDVARFKALGLIASMQPSHASDDMRWAGARLGPGRVDGAYAWRWFLDAGVPLAFGSDFPVEVVNPFYGIYAALTRQDEQGRPPGGWHPDQRMSLEETLRAFTAGSAYAQFAEGRLGVIKVGSRADVVVVERDLFRATPAEVLRTRVDATVVEGEVVYEAAPRSR